MLFRVRNQELVQYRERTFLTAAVAVAGTTLTVQAVDANAWADDDYIIVGEIGSKTAEILRIAAAVSDGTSLTITQTAKGVADAGGCRYSHAIGEPVYRIGYNQIEFSRATTSTGTKTVLSATEEIQPDDLFTRYEDATNTTGYGFVRFRNGSTHSAYSDAIPYSGYTKKSLGRMIKAVRRQLDNPDFRQLEDEDIIEELNEKQRDVAHERLWPFYEDIFSAATVAYQRQYDIDDNVIDGKVHTITCRSEPLAKIDRQRDDILHWDTATVGEPTRFGIWGNDIILHPTPSSGAATDELNGDITATVTTITLDDASSFHPSGRVIIGSEVISYNSISSDEELLGCIRGLEETTAATHSDTDAVTSRDIIYSAHREPEELADTSDETKIPDPLVLIYGASMELALGKLGNTGLHDRMKIKYDQSIERLRDKFGRKGTSSYYRIKDKDEVVTDNGRTVNPNNYPTGITN